MESSNTVTMVGDFFSTGSFGIGSDTCVHFLNTDVPSTKEMKRKGPILVYHLVAWGPSAT